MRVLVFNIRGIYAHFRKIYTNSSSLSYNFPPPTTIAGMVAAMLGRQRDSYYEEFGEGKFKVGVRILKPLRKMTHTINYMMVKRPKDLYIRQDPTQIPFEILTGVDGEVEYCIYFWHSDGSILNELFQRISSGRFAFPLYLGAAPFSCIVTGGKIVTVEELSSDSTVAVSSVINTSYIVQDSIEMTYGLTRIIKDIVPVYFNSDRVAQKTAGVIFDEKCMPIKLKLKEEFVCIDNENIVFI